MNKEIYKVTDKENTLRLDKVLTIFNKKNSRVYYSNLIKNGEVLVNGNKVSPSYKVRENDEISINYVEKEDEKDLKPLELALDVVYEDNDVLVINKPKGLVVHPGGGHYDDTLVNALIYNEKELSNINGLNRVGIVHRIDKDTSGLLLICKNNFAHKEIASQLETHSMHREYIALVDGIITSDSGKIIGKIGRSKENRLKMAIDNINGKEAITHFEVLKRYKKYTLIKCRLETGRTHQIRVHMSSINHPLVGDKIYGGSTSLYNEGQLLHAYNLTFIQPSTKKEVNVQIDLPQYFIDVLNKLEN
ncbi:MAG: RluA family pseudouridine synthase [Candidatus Onthovivens sp.]|nr:RluA family pseudouridine synthase [Candidatus Onthovivens sp.]